MDELSNSRTAFFDALFRLNQLIDNSDFAHIAPLDGDESCDLEAYPTLLENRLRVLAHYGRWMLTYFTDPSDYAVANEFRHVLDNETVTSSAYITAADNLARTIVEHTDARHFDVASAVSAYWAARLIR